MALSRAGGINDPSWNFGLMDGVWAGGPPFRTQHFLTRGCPILSRSVRKGGCATAVTKKLRLHQAHDLFVRVTIQANKDPSTSLGMKWLGSPKYSRSKSPP